MSNTQVILKVYLDEQSLLVRAGLSLVIKSTDQDQIHWEVHNSGMKQDLHMCVCVCGTESIESSQVFIHVSI